MLDGLRRILLGLAARLGGEPAEAESEAPEEGAALLGSELRCIIEDTIVPALRRLEALIDEWAPADAGPDVRELSRARRASPRAD
jgi:hypothetical protein